MHDVAIIGGGVSGLGTAYHLRDSGLDIRILERNHALGGRARAVPVAGETVSMATAFVYSGTETERMCLELGIPFVPIEFGAFAYHSGGTTTIAPNDEALIQGLDMSEEGKRALWDVLRKFRADYDKYAGHGLLPESDELAGIGMLDYLGDLPQEVVDFLGVISLGGSMTHPEELSARFGMRYVASYLLRDPEHRNSIDGGLNRIPLALADAIDAGAIMRGIDVQSVTQIEGGYEVDYLDHGHPAQLQARHVVMALQAPLIEDLVHPELPGWKQDALDSIPFSPYVGMHVVLSPGADNPWADVLAAFPADLSFSLVIHQTLQLRKGRLESEPATLHLYAVREHADAAINRDDDEVLAEEWLEDLYRLYPAARGRVIGHRFIKWRYSWPYVRASEPERLEALQRPVGRMHFAGDWTTEEGATYGALASARRVAAEITGS